MECCGPGYASPEEAIRAPRELLLYTIAIYTGTGIQKPDYLATIDVDPNSPTFSKVIHRLDMPNIGDELHHMGWNACSSCHDDAGMARKYLLLPGVRSNNIYVVDTATDPLAPRIHTVIDGAESNPRLIYLAPIRCIALGAKSSFLFLVMLRARHRGAICISTRILKLLVGGKTQWVISNLAMIFGTSLAIM